MSDAAGGSLTVAVQSPSDGQQPIQSELKTSKNDTDKRTGKEPRKSRQKNDKAVRTEKAPPRNPMDSASSSLEPRKQNGRRRIGHNGIGANPGENKHMNPARSSHLEDPSQGARSEASLSNVDAGRAVSPNGGETRIMASTKKPNRQPHGKNKSRNSSQPGSRNVSEDEAAGRYNQTTAFSGQSGRAVGPGRNARKSRFDAKLSNGSSLTATAPSFTPSSAPSDNNSKGSASPVNQSLRERLTSELSNATYDCSICFCSLSRTAQIHSCSICHTSFHLSCVSKWASKSVEETADRAALISTRNGTTPSKTELEGSWRCPGCQTSSSAENIPKEYRCFCLRVKDPSHRPPATPHSCGMQCARPKPEGCKHPCQLLCHPGPCPPCGIMLTLQCHCDKQTLQVRCSSVNNESTLIAGNNVSTAVDVLSCTQTCGKLLKCGLHSCGRVCHSGPCDLCDEERDKRCFCGKETINEPCGGGKLGSKQDRVENCTRPSTEKDKERWTGEWSCDQKCAAPYDCIYHKCELPCHPHTSAEPPPCPFSPEKVETCPCGSTPVNILISSPRSSCQSPIPTCPLSCPKVLACGHICDRPCHHGACGSCDQMVASVCRCGSTRGKRRCGDSSAEDEILCNQICRAIRNCGRHECLRKCCPLAYQEGIRSNKSKRRQAANMFQVEDDPMGFHACDRVCGRNLNCGHHACEMQDHRGPCPPCLQAGFDEVVCHCGSTVMLPPIPCSAVVDCRYPCIRLSTCGHPQMPHACHENPDGCPLCPFLMEKQCPCGKKMVGNVRCSQDQSKVSCGLPCGKLLRCGFHRCRKSCHAAGDCESCDQICLKPRRICGHPCPETCHAPKSCPVDSPCPKLIDVTCGCGNLKQKAKCAVCATREEGNSERRIKCTDACILAKRNTALADALGIEKKEPKVREVEYQASTLTFYASNITWATVIENSLTDFVQSNDKPSLHLPVMKRPQREFTHELAELFDLKSESLDEEPRRSIVIHRTANCVAPTPTLADALAAQRKSASTTLSFANLRKAPERALNNAIIIEGVLSFDDSMLFDILRPHMRGLEFALVWLSDEIVVITFDHPSPKELDTKVNAIQGALKSLIQETGIGSSTETVTLSEDGQIVRGSWTPVASSSSRSANYKSASIASRNAFASLGGGVAGTSPPDAAPPPLARTPNAWGGLIGPAQYRPPRAVIAPVTGQERPPLPPVASMAAAKAKTRAAAQAEDEGKESEVEASGSTEREEQKEEDIPDSWDDADE